MRECPFCESASARRFGTRHDATFVRCNSCRSIYRDIGSKAFQRLHEQAFEEDEFLDRVIAAAGTKPDFAAWDRLELPGATILEIGSGAGHLLAAAAARHRNVIAVESSARHREFIQRTWGIDTLFRSLDELPPALTVDAIVAVNVLEHVYEVSSLLSAIRRHLVPGGVFYFSAPSADALVCSLIRTMWSMFKEPDHVSFPSRAGVRAAARKAGFVVEHLSSDEMAFETPVGLGVAVRDRWRDRPLRDGAVASLTTPAVGLPTKAIGGAGSRALARLNAVTWARYEPSRIACVILGRAATIKATLRRPLN